MELPSYRLPRFSLWFSQVWGSAGAFLRRAGTIILAASIVLWLLLSFPRLDDAELSTAAGGGTRAQALENSYAGRAGHIIEPLIAPLGFDWKIGVGLIASLAAREVIVATLAQIYAASDDEASLRASIRADRDPTTGALVFDPPTVAALLVFFVFALQCTSTIAIMARETNSWKWPAFAFSYMLVLAWTMSFASYHIVAAIVRAS
jgi:ferrous iron transport protein B